MQDDYYHQMCLRDHYLKLEQMSQTIRDDPRFKLLNFFDGLTWLLIVLSVVVALFIISMLQITGDLPDATESTGMYIFDMIFTVAFAVELSMRIECYRFVHGRVCPDFFRDPMVVIDTARGKTIDQTSSTSHF